MTTATTSAVASGAAPTTDIDATAAQSLLARDGCVLVDVREPDEHARERIAGATLVPLSTLTAAKIAALGAQRVLVHCKSGRRSADAAARCAELASRGIEVTSVRGGIEAWKAAGLPTVVDASRPKLGVMQQTQLAIGVAVVAGTALGALVDPWFLVIPAFMGSGLIFAGATGFCGLATLLAKMPWNKPVKASASCETGSCAR